MITKKSLENRIHGWFPQEPLKPLKTVNLNKPFSERYKEALKLYRRERIWMAIANVVTVAFFAPSFYSHGERIEIDWLTWAILVVVLLLENTLIFWYYRKHPYRKEENRDES